MFLPWYHAYRLFVQGAMTQEHQTGKPFRQDSAAALASSNIMDRWILAACNSLLGFVRIEMEAYRLYTVVPRLVAMIDQLTNWSHIPRGPAAQLLNSPLSRPAPACASQVRPYEQGALLWRGGCS